MHVASSKFLSCFEVESRYENQNYEVKLEDYTSEESVWMVIPAFKYQVDGEQDVNAGEMCAITRANRINNKVGYINCSLQEIREMRTQFM